MSPAWCRVGWQPRVPTQTAVFGHALILFFKHESDWPCLSPLVGSCLRRDTPEAAAILGKSLSASASTEELVLTASSVLLVLPASSVHHADYTIAITQRRFTTEYPSSYPPRAISLRISSSSSQLAHETSTTDSRRFASSRMAADSYRTMPTNGFHERPWEENERAARCHALHHR